MKIYAVWTNLGSFDPIKIFTGSKDNALEHCMDICYRADIEGILSGPIPPKSVLGQCLDACVDFSGYDCHGRKYLELVTKDVEI